METIIEQENKKRLIVLVPDCLSTDMNMAHKIHWMATRDHCDVLYLTLISDEEKLMAVSLQMATMKAVTAGSWLVVSSKLTDTRAWLRTLREVYRPGDILVCHEEQWVKDGLFRTRPASDYLRETLHVPVDTIAGFYHPEQVQINHWLHSLLFWVGCLVILGIFTFIEIQMDQNAQGAARMVVLVMLVFFEIAAIWTWTSISE
jgi:hypothetical protein